MIGRLVRKVHRCIKSGMSIDEAAAFCEKPPRLIRRIMKNHPLQQEPQQKETKELNQEHDHSPVRFGINNKNAMIIIPDDHPLFKRADEGGHFRIENNPAKADALRIVFVVGGPFQRPGTITRRNHKNDTSPLEWHVSLSKIGVEGYELLNEEQRAFRITEIEPIDGVWSKDVTVFHFPDHLSSVIEKRGDHSPEKTPIKRRRRRYCSPPHFDKTVDQDEAVKRMRADLEKHLATSTPQPLTPGITFVPATVGQAMDALLRAAEREFLIVDIHFKMKGS